LYVIPAAPGSFLLKYSFFLLSYAFENILIAYTLSHATNTYVVSLLLTDVAGEFDLAQLALGEGPQEQVLVHLLSTLQWLDIAHLHLSRRSW